LKKRREHVSSRLLWRIGRRSNVAGSRANWLLFLSDIRGRMWMGNLRLACDSGSDRRPDRDPRNLNKDKAEAVNKEEKVFVFYRQQSDACRRASVLFASNFHKTRPLCFPLCLWVLSYPIFYVRDRRRAGLFKEYRRNF